MVANPPEGMPRITPYLLYQDVEAALKFLSTTFGFRERMRLPDKDGKILHAEMDFCDGVVMMGNPGPDYQNPKTLGHTTQMLYVYVDDVDAHYSQSRAAGATILQEPEDQFYGDRNYRTEDGEGHQWTFGQHVRDASLDELG